MLKAYKYRLYPNKEQEIQIQKTFGCCRFVYNQTLAYRRNLYETKKESLSKIDCNNWKNKTLKTEYLWLKEVDKFALDNAVINMDSAYQKFFKEHAGYPKFKSKRDIKKQIIRCVGDPKERFSEDALRILRAIRFSSQLDFVIEPNTSFYVSKMCEKLENISMERISSEFCKIVMSSNFCVQMALYGDDVFSQIIPEIKDMIKFPQNNPYHIYDVYGHTLHATEAYDFNCENDLNPKDLITALAVFFHDIGKPHCYQDDEDGVRHFKGHGRVSADMTDEIMKRLRFDNDTREKVVELVYYHDATFEVGKKYVKRWLNKIGEEQFRRLLNVRRADIKAQAYTKQESRLQKIDNIEYILEEVLQKDECFSLKDLAINGNDLIEIGYKPGKEIGNTLNCLLQLVIEGVYPNEKDELLKYVETTNVFNEIEKWI